MKFTRGVTMLTTALIFAVRLAAYDDHDSGSESTQHLGAARMSLQLQGVGGTQSQGGSGSPSEVSGTGGSSKPSGATVVKRNNTNTLEFDHLNLTANSDFPYVLRARDGGYFQLRVNRTDPRKFSYTISAVESQPTQAAFTLGNSIETRRGDLRDGISVIMRHSHVGRYRVDVALRPGIAEDAETRLPGTSQQGAAAPLVSAPPAPPPAQLPPPTRPGQPPPPPTPPPPSGQGTSTPTPPPADEPVRLYSASFDLWVETDPGWHVDFSGAMLFSGLTDNGYFIDTQIVPVPDSITIPPAQQTVSTVRLDTNKDSFRPTIAAIANIHSVESHGLGVAFGMGMNASSDPRYFFGGSYLLGGKFILTGGWTGGKAAVLPAGQEVNKAPIAGANTLQNMRSQFRSGVFIGLGFTFVDRENEFKAFFPTATTSASGAAAATISIKLLQGDYADNAARIYSVAPTADEGITLTVKNADGSGTPETYAFSKMDRMGLAYSKKFGAVDVTVTFGLDEQGKIVSKLTFKKGAAAAIEATRTP